MHVADWLLWQVASESPQHRLQRFAMRGGKKVPLCRHAKIHEMQAQVQKILTVLLLCSAVCKAVWNSVLNNKRIIFRKICNHEVFTFLELFLGLLNKPGLHFCCKVMYCQLFQHGVHNEWGIIADPSNKGISMIKLHGVCLVNASVGTVE